MRLRLLFIFIIAYILGAFGWLTFSLVDFTNVEYDLRKQRLEAGRQACILRLIEKGKNLEFVTAQAAPMQFKQAEITADTILVNQFLSAFNYGSYRAQYTNTDGKLNIDVDIAPFKMEELNATRNRRITLYGFQAILLTLLVGVGVYGVWYSIQMIYRLNKQQNNFLLSVTHELKTPIAAMKLNLQTIQSRELPDEVRKELVGRAIQNSDRLNELAENMLTAMQIENKNYDYAKESFSLTDMVYRLIESYKLRTELTHEVEPDIHMIGDLFVLRISLNNLLENAIKYGAGNPVHISLKRAEDKAVIQVEDQGIGIPEGERKKIFRKFYRVEDEEVRESKGTGLGLFIAKGSIEKHNGEIKVLANNPRGTVFKITLPVLSKNE